MIVEKFQSDRFILPCVVDYIDYEHHAAIDIIQHRDQLFKKGDTITYDVNDKWVDLLIQKIIKNKPVQTEAKMENRTDFRKVRYFCIKQASVTKVS